jgi:hypothetical protein
VTADGGVRGHLGASDAVVSVSPGCLRGRNARKIVDRGRYCYCRYQWNAGQLHNRSANESFETVVMFKCLGWKLPNQNFGHVASHLQCGPQSLSAVPTVNISLDKTTYVLLVQTNAIHKFEGAR